MRPVMILALLTLAACGADGAPLRPGAETAVPASVTVSGDASIGVSTGG